MRRKKKKKKKKKKNAARAALEIADGGLLPGLEADWIDAKRAELSDLRLELLELVAACGFGSAASSSRVPSRRRARRSRRRRSASLPARR